MPIEPTLKRAFAFFDGQNLFYAAKEAFGYPYPNFDPKLLAERICATQGWSVAGIGSMDQADVRFPDEPNSTEGARHQRNGLDSHRPRHL